MTHKYDLYSEKQKKEIKNYLLSIIKSNLLYQNGMENLSNQELEQIILKDKSIKSDKIKRNINIKKQLKKSNENIWNFGLLFFNEIEVLLSEKDSYEVYSEYYGINKVCNLNEATELIKKVIFYGVIPR